MRVEEILEKFVFSLKQSDRKLETGKEIKFQNDVKLIKKLIKEVELTNTELNYNLKEKGISWKKAQNMLKRHNIYMQCRKRKGKRTVLSLSMRVIYKILKLTPETLSELLDLIDNGATTGNVEKYLKKYFPEGETEVSKENVMKIHTKVKVKMSSLKISKLTSKEIERLYNFLGKADVVLKNYVKPRKGYNKHMESLNTVMIS